MKNNMIVNPFDVENARYYHYSSLEALVGGIILPEPLPPMENPPYNPSIPQAQQVCLWASDSRYMNDKDECRFGLKVVGSLQSKFPDLDFSLSNHHVSTAFISFSQTLDSLPMWNMYGRNGSGVMLVFNSLSGAFAYNRGRRIIPTRVQCEYCKTKQYNNSSYINSIVDRFTLLYKAKLLDVQDIFTNTLQEIIAAIKREEYKYENETRLVFLNMNYKYRVSNNIIVPYIPVYFHKLQLCEIWIGPTQDQDRSAQSLRMFLDSRGFEHVIIKKSEIPYRG